MVKLYYSAKNRISAAARKFFRKEEGASMVEYGLLVGLIAVVCILVVAALGTEVANIFDVSQKAVKDAPTNQKTPS